MPKISPEDIARVFPGLDSSAKGQIKLLWITCGAADGLVEVNRTFHDWLNSRGVTHTYIEVPDVGHVWPFWRQNLADFAPLLFR
jgi:S-formylglutathione hydrolase FrmB